MKLLKVTLKDNEDYGIVEDGDIILKKGDGVSIISQLSQKRKSMSSGTWKIESDQIAELDGVLFVGSGTLKERVLAVAVIDEVLDSKISEEVEEGNWHAFTFSDFKTMGLQGLKGNFKPSSGAAVGEYSY